MNGEGEMSNCWYDFKVYLYSDFARDTRKRKLFKAGDGNKINSITLAIFRFTDIAWKHKRKIYSPRNNVRIGHNYVCRHSCNPKYPIISNRPRCKRGVVEAHSALKKEKLCHSIVILLVKMFRSVFIMSIHRAHHRSRWLKSWLFFYSILPCYRF